MPVIDLSGCGLGRAYVRLLSVMFEPHDAVWRTQFEDSMFASAVLARGGRAFGESGDQLPEGVDQVRIIKAMAAATREVPVTEIWDKRIAGSTRHADLKGVICGLILGHALATGGTLDDVKASMEARARADGRRGYAPASLARDWARFRCVSHIWLAHALVVGPVGKALPSIENPNVINDVLGNAEDLRRRAELHRTGTRRVPLFEPGEAWTFIWPDEDAAGLRA